MSRKSTFPNESGSERAACAVDNDGNYTAPQILPVSSVVNLVATSVADPSKQATAVVTVTGHFTLQLSAPANVQAGGSSQLTTTLTAQPDSNPSPSVSWAVEGTGCTGSACGSLTVTTSQSARSVPATTAVYTAPQSSPQPNTVLVSVTPQADPSKRVQANITIQSGGTISISPASSTLAANRRLTFTASLGGSAGGGLNWSVNGIAGGNATVGQICVAGSSPCASYSAGAASQVDYIAQHGNDCAHGRTDFRRNGTRNEQSKCCLADHGVRLQPGRQLRDDHWNLHRSGNSTDTECIADYGRQSRRPDTMGNF